MISGRHWLLLCAMGWAAASAAPPAAPVPAGAQAPAAAHPVPSATDPPDDDFIAFLGADDVGDTAWWEFLKKQAPRGEDPPAPPTQDAK